MNKVQGGGFLAGTGCAYMAEPVPGIGVSDKKGGVEGVQLSEPRCAYMAKRVTNEVRGS